MITLNDRFLELGKGTNETEKLVQDIMGSNSPVKVTQLKGGITNQLLLVEQNGLRMLVRAFGKGTDSFIDRPREFVVHNQLQRLGLAPKLYGQFGNGLIYGYVPGRTTEASELGEQYTMKNVARRLAQWHATLNPKSIKQELEQVPNSKPLGDFWTVLKEWVDMCPDEVLPVTKKQLQEEFDSVKSKISELGGAQVMGHCDLLSANILVPASTDIREGVPEAPFTVKDKNILAEVRSEAAFIDYEYSIPCPRAFDIANHFQEWQGYECDRSRVPKPDRSSEKLVYWCEEYLKVLKLLTGSAPTLDELLTELQAWWGMPGFYWGVWSAIQSRSSDIDFGYHDYAAKRFSEFTSSRRR